MQQRGSERGRRRTGDDRRSVGGERVTCPIYAVVTTSSSDRFPSHPRRPLELHITPPSPFSSLRRRASRAPSSSLVRLAGVCDPFVRSFVRSFVRHALTVKLVDAWAPAAPAGSQPVPVSDPRPSPHRHHPVDPCSAAITSQQHRFSSSSLPTFSSSPSSLSRCPRSVTMVTATADLSLPITELPSAPSADVDGGLPGRASSESAVAMRAPSASPPPLESVVSAPLPSTSVPSSPTLPPPSTPSSADPPPPLTPTSGTSPSAVRRPKRDDGLVMASCHQCKTTKVQALVLSCRAKADPLRKVRTCRKKYCSTYGSNHPQRSCL